MAVEKISIEVVYEKLERGDLTPEELSDLELAIDARRNASADYSDFYVGATVRAGNDTLYTGWNTESIGFDALHAEHSAVGRMKIDDRKTGIKRITVVGGPRIQGGLEPVTPCGDCRQNTLEHVLLGQNPEVVMAGIRGTIIYRAKLRDLLPLGFFPACLKS